MNTKIIPDLCSISIKYAEEQNLVDMEWEGEFSHFRQLYHDIYFASLRNDAIIWLADLPGFGIIGQIFAQLSSSRRDYADGFSRAYLFGFRVRPQYQNNGVGRLLLTTAEEELKTRGFHYAVLNVSKSNQYALRYYLKSGYTIEGDEPGKWSYTDQFGKIHEVNDPSWRLQKIIQLD